MSMGHNSFTMIGNLTDLPKSKTVKGDKTLAEFNVAINNRRSKSKTATYAKATAWSGLGDVCTRYLKSGSSVLLVGSLKVNQYTDKNGNKQEKPEFTVQTMTMLGDHSSAGMMVGIVAGRLTRDPEQSIVGNGLVKARFRIAINDPRRKDDDAVYLTVEMLGKSAEIAMKVLKKGKAATFVGRLSANSYEKRDGSGKSSSVVFTADNFELVGGRGRNDGEASDSLMGSTVGGYSKNSRTEIPF